MPSFLDESGVRALWAKVKQRDTDLQSKLTETGELTAYKATRDGDGNVISNTYVKNAVKGVANGVASLDASGKVPSAQLPGSVDDIVEGQYTNSTTFTPATSTAPVKQKGIIYFDTSTNKSYRWSGSAYVEIVANMGTGRDSSTVFRGDWGKQLEDDVAALEAQIGSGGSGTSILGRLDAIEAKNTQQDTAIAGKANAQHTHAISDVNNLQAELDKKVNKYVIGTEAIIGQINNSGNSIKIDVSGDDDTDSFIEITNQKVVIQGYNDLLKLEIGNGTISRYDVLEEKAYQLLDASMALGESWVNSNLT